MERKITLEGIRVVVQQRSWNSLCWLDKQTLAQKTRVGPLRRERIAVYLLGAPGVGKTSIWRRSRLLHELGVTNYVAGCILRISFPELFMFPCPKIEDDSRFTWTIAE